MQYEIKKIAGLDCVFVPMHDAYSVTVEVFVKAGSVYEDRKINGISHFLEHMFFKGGKKYTTPQAVAQAVEQFGGTFNAFTSGHYAGYYVKSAPSFAGQALDVLADMLVHAQFPKPEMEREKQVVIQEIMMYEDEPQELVVDQWNRWYFGDTSYGRSTLGTKENVLSFSQDDLFAYKQELYTKDNMIIVIAGNILDQKGIEERIASLFAKLPACATRAKPSFVHTLPRENTASLQKKTQQNHLVISAPGYLYTDEEKYAARMLGTILGGNMSSRLFQRIREKEGLCYYISASHYPSKESGAFMMRAGLDKERFSYGVEKIFAEIAEIVATGITEKEFSDTLGYLRGKIAMGLETSDSVSGFVGQQYLLYNEIKTMEQMLAAYEKCSIQDVCTVTKKLQKENLYLYWIE